MKRHIADALDTRIEDQGSRWQISLRLDGKPVSGLGVVKKKMRIGAATVRMGGVAGVWTHKDHRLKGFASRAMQEGIALMKAENYPFSILFGITDFYHRYGYGVAFPSSTIDVETQALPRSRGPHTIRTMARADIPLVAQLYNRCNAARSGTVVRAKDWQPAWRMPRMGEGTQRRQGRGIVACHPSGRITGYAVYDAQAGHLHVSELSGMDGAAFHTLAAALGRRARAGGAKRIRFHLPEDDPFGAFCGRYGCRWHIGHPRNGGSMGGIVDLTALMKKLTPAFAHRLNVSGAEWDRPIRLVTDIGLVDLVKDGASVAVNTPTRRRATAVDIPQMALMQLVMGYRSVRDVAYDQDVNIPATAFPALDALFPTGYPYMWWTDRF